MKDELPEGWDVVKLPEVCQLNPGKPDASRVTGDTQVTFVPMAAVDAELGQITKPILRAYTEVSKGFTAFQENDVIMAKITPCMENGKAAIARGLSNGIGFGSTEFHVLRHNRAILPEYLFYFIRQDSFRGSAEASMTGSVGQKRVPLDFLRDTVLPLPPTNEQLRIVAKLEKLLSGVAAAQARLATIPHILKRFRQSILAAACSGKLTADWRKEDLDMELAAQFVGRVEKERKVKHERKCSETSERGLRKPKHPKNDFAAVVDNDAGGLLEGWCVTRIGDISDCLDYMRVPVNKTERLERQGPIPYYGANGQVGWIDDFIFNEELVLVVEDETFIGREKPFSYIIKGKAWVNNHAHVLRPLGGMSAEFLNISLSYYDFTPLTSGTTGRRKLNQEALVKAPVHLPPLIEQQEIVRRVEALFKTADALEARYQTAKAHVDKLTQSILAKAFRGELVPQDPDDEPASALIENIRQQSSGHRVNKRGKKAVGT